MEDTFPSCSEIIREVYAFAVDGISTPAFLVILASLAPITLKQYATERLRNSQLLLIRHRINCQPGY